MFKKYINKFKLLHMYSVANYMRENAYKYGLKADEMYVVGLLHDIGYLQGRQNHSSYGAELLSSTFGNVNSNVIQAIRLHDTICDEWENEAKDNVVLFLLVKADLSIDTQGRFIGRKARLKDIEKRYGRESIEYNVAISLNRYIVMNEKRFLKKR